MSPAVERGLGLMLEASDSQNFARARIGRIEQTTGLEPATFSFGNLTRCRLSNRRVYPIVVNDSPGKPT